MIKVIVKREFLNSKDENKVEKVTRDRITLTDENGNHISGVQSIQINLDVMNHPVLIMKTIDFELDGEFEDNEVKEIKEKNESKTIKF